MAPVGHILTSIVTVPLGIKQDYLLFSPCSFPSSYRLVADIQLLITIVSSDSNYIISCLVVSSGASAVSSSGSSIVSSGACWSTSAVSRGVCSVQ